MLLDVGCGNNACGDINLDLKYYPNSEQFIIADAQNLPFRPIFKKVYASHVLEHCLNPIKALREFGSVAQLVEIRVPDKCYQIREQDDHLYTWTRDSLYNLLKKFFHHVIVTSNFRIKGGDMIQKLRLEGLIRLTRWITKQEIVAVAWGYNGS